MSCMMHPETLFMAANLTALCGWIALTVGIVRRENHWRDRVAGWVFPLLLCAGYTLLIALSLPRAEGNFTTLAGVQQLFRSPGVALAGWAHYLAFDLCIGVRVAREVMESGRRRRVLGLLLPAVFFLGPLGLLLHFMMGGLSGRKPCTAGTQDRAVGD